MNLNYIKLFILSLAMSKRAAEVVTPNYIKLFILSLAMSKCAAEVVTPVKDIDVTSTEKSVKSKDLITKALRKLEIEQLQLANDVEELKNRRFLIMYIDEAKIRNILLKRSIQKQREILAEAELEISNLEFQRSSLIVQVNADNREAIGQEFNNKERQIKLLRQELDDKKIEMTDRDNEIFVQCMRQALFQYLSTHTEETKDGSVMIDTRSLISHLQSLEPNSHFMVKDCTQEITALALGYFLKLQKADLT
jgi:hypothetical protein